jgi:hypothetical protein
MRVPEKYVKEYKMSKLTAAYFADQKKRKEAKEIIIDASEVDLI